MIALETLALQYRSLLMDQVVPFWFRHGIDWTYGGVCTCMTEEGQRLSGDKYIWSQARSVWTFSALHNRIEKRAEFLRAAENSIRFLLAHGRDQDGRWIFQARQEGGVVQGAISIYSDCFVIYGILEYLRAVKDHGLLGLALSTFDRVRERIEQPDFCETAPYKLTPGFKVHGVPMIMVAVTEEVIRSGQGPNLESLLDEYVDRILTGFVRPDRQLLLENLGRHYEELPAPQGTLVVPGHAIESMWFILHTAARRGDEKLIRKAVQVIRWHLEAGWDYKHGGLFLAIDADGHEPCMTHWDKKLWWPHTEALYALLLAHCLTGEQWCLDWYERIHDWSFSHFPMPQVGEWRQRLDREGRPCTEVVALPVKDPFHLPRAAILIAELLSGKAYGPTERSEKR